MRAAPNQPPCPPAAPTRALAAILALLVFGLHLLASAPAAHAWLHSAVAHAETCVTADDHATPASADHPDAAPAAHHDAACVVSLFAQGLTAAPAAPHLAAPQNLALVATPPEPTRPPATAPARLHPPAHAPPSAA